MGRKHYHELIVGTVHIMKQLLVEVEGLITLSVQLYSVKRRAFYHLSQTETPFSSPPQRKQMFCYIYPDCC